ncbi:protein phosphatase 2C domain-containing protein [Sphingomonas crusticola]|uniref:protein phosphatase 2C domain-containing protein n=1 Tax=Sphingomonas crusticola TaxID=1697973 RepID=UPI0013C33BD6|nr:protein phosphatase 2C domain-containing protein [Sphingomonas crusticola]
MHFDLIQSVSLAGSALVPNDDRAGAADTLAWVIDGATDLGPPGLMGARGGAAWLASAAQAYLQAATDAPIERLCTDLAANLEAAYAATRTRDPIGRWELPMASMLAVRLGDSLLESAWLGDCAGLIRSGDRVTRLGPPRQGKDDEAAMASSLAQHGLGNFKRCAPIVEELRRSRSGPGKRILGVEAETMASVESARIACMAGDELLLMSDGFSALVDAYGLISEAELMAALAEQGLAALAVRLREVEAADAACARFPRFKGSDDATALWLRIGG